MGGSSPNKPPASAQGTLDKRPLAHLLVYVLEKRLEGSLVLRTPEGFEWVVVFSGGSPAKIAGPSLPPAGADAPRFAALLDVPDATAFAFYERYDALEGVAPAPVDPLPWVLRGLRKRPPLEHVRQVLARVGAAPLRLMELDVARFEPNADEQRVMEALGAGPASVAELAVRSGSPVHVTELVAYALLVTKRAVPTVQAAATPLVTPPVAPSPEHVVRRKAIEDRARAIDDEDYFRMLGVPRDATAEAIEASYVEQVRTWHPDRLPPALADLREACSRVFARLSEARRTLVDPELHERYMRLLSEGGATPKDQETIADVVEASTSFQKAEFYLKRNDLPQAEAHARRALSLDDQQADYHALCAWIDALKSPEDRALGGVIARLTKAVEMNDKCERAYYYRGMAHKRAGNLTQAVRDFQQAAELNPRNLDAVREVRLHEMRATKPASRRTDPGSMVADRDGKGAAESDKGLLRRLFKK